MLDLTGANAVAPNSMGTLHIWTTTDVRLSGISLNLVETGGGIKFMGPMDVPNPNTRWAFLDGPQEVTNSAANHIGGAAIPGAVGDGVGPGTANAANGNNVLIGSIPYMALGSGTSQLQLQVGGNGIADFTGAFAQVKFGTDSAANVAGDAFGMGGAVGTIAVTGGGGDLPVITPVAVGEVEQATTIVRNLMASNGPITWSALTPTTGSPAMAATLTPGGEFSWNPAGSRRGPKGNGVQYSWTATATNAAGAATGVAITLSLIPEPATMSLFGLALVGTLGLVRRRS
jgi:hypothetical protein